MTDPTFVARHGLYTITWDAPIHIRMDVERVHSETRGGDITAEVKVSSTSPGLPGLLHLARCTLTGTQSRATLARHLATRTPGQDVDWPGLIEITAVRVIEAHRVGEPGILLRNAAESDAPDYLLAPLILGGEMPTMWFGDGGSGKSLLALAAGLSIHTDRDLLGIAPSATRVVALLDWEMDGGTHKARMRQLVGEQMPDLVYVPCRGAIWDEADRLRRIIAQYGITFGIIDSVGLACGGLPLVADESANRFYTALRSLGIGSLCIAHKTKSDEGDRFPFGSQFWHNGARLTWYVKPEAENDPQLLHVAMHQRKRNTTGPADPLAFAITFGEERIAIARRDLRDVPAFDEDRTLRERIYDVLRVGPQPVAAIAEELGAKPDSVSRTVRRFERTFVRTPRPDGVVLVALRASHE